jgi:hypothetical protein
MKNNGFERWPLEAPSEGFRQRCWAEEMVVGFLVQDPVVGSLERENWKIAFLFVGLFFYFLFS